MAYHPTFYLPIDLAHYIDTHIEPLEKAMNGMLAQHSLNPSSRASLMHNLKCFRDFKEEKEAILEQFNERLPTSHITHFKR